MQTLRTQTLVLRRYAVADLEAFVRLLADAEVMRHMEDGRPYSRARARELFGRVLAAAVDVWAGFEAGGGRHVGHAMLVPFESPGDVELGFVVARECWGRGLATEMGRAVLDYGFRVRGLSRVYGTVDADHPASVRVLEKLGMRRLREASDAGGIYFVYVVEAPAASG